MTARSSLRHDLDRILAEAIAAVDAGGLVRRALDGSAGEAVRRARAVDVVAAGKAAHAMLDAFRAAAPVSVRTLLGVGPRRAPDRATPSSDVRWFDAGHPLPDEGSLAGATAALDVAGRTRAGDLLLVLLSGGGSALMALPAPGLSLEVKQATARTLMAQGADIHELNTVRKHLSAIKGGRLAAVAGGDVLTLALSDVVGDDLSVIASGPTVPDQSTFAEALAVLTRRGGVAAYADTVVAHLRRGEAGDVAESPKPGDPRLARAAATVIGAQRGAIDGARRAAERRGYHVHVVADPVTGEAREAARAHLALAAAIAAAQPRPLCIISSGETTVTVTGPGRGGRNQEFALALAPDLSRVAPQVVAASIGTDGIDGPTDAAGAVVDPSTVERARAAGLDLDRHLSDNNAYEFFRRLGDLIVTGPTSTNVGDLQVLLVGDGPNGSA